MQEIPGTTDKGDSLVFDESSAVDVKVIESNEIAAIGRPADTAPGNQRELLTYILLPAIFLTAALLGGVRIASADGALIFLPPALVCLVFAAILIILYFRAGLVSVHGWFSEDFPTVKNVANAAVLFSLAAATAQLFNALIPEQGLPFWVVSFCFFWTLWNNLFAEFDTKRLLRSLAALFGLAFVVKYLVLANLAAPEGGNWLRNILENPGKEAFTWLLDLPRYSAGTGYIQFFTVILYLAGLYLLPNSTRSLRR